jgi:hypothetical protein
VRALGVAREIGPAAKVDLGAGYLGLLGDGDCEVRKVACRALGEMRERRALARLRTLAEARDTRRLGSIIIGSRPACGSQEAGEAVKRVEGR